MTTLSKAPVKHFAALEFASRVNSAPADISFYRKGNVAIRSDKRCVSYILYCTAIASYDYDDGILTVDWGGVSTVTTTRHIYAILDALSLASMGTKLDRTTANHILYA